MTLVIKVLLIEDNRIESLQTQRWLTSATRPSFEVESVDHLQAGICRLAQGGIDIVVLDLNLPDSRGLETFLRLHEQFSDVPMVVLTGDLDETIGPMAVERGAQDYLVKGQCDGKGLSHVLQYAFARHRLQLDQLAAEHRRQVAEVAQEVQLRMLPQVRPTVPGYDFWDYYQAAENIGGDHFGYMKLSENRIAISIADVCGKGVSAALTMAELGSEVRHCLEMSGDVNTAMNRLNRHFCERSRLITFSLCILDHDEHTLTIANAGHMPPLRRMASTNRVDSLSPASCRLPFGVQPEEDYPADVFTIQPGDLLLMYTDGITDEWDTQQSIFGKDKLIESLRRSPSTVENVVKSVIGDVEQFRRSLAQSDDMCVVCFARNDVTRRQVSKVHDSALRHANGTRRLPEYAGFVDSKMHPTS